MKIGFKKIHIFISYGIFTVFIVIKYKQLPWLQFVYLQYMRF